MTAPPPAVVVAGGAGRRMGGAVKGLLMLGERRLIDHLCAGLAPQVGRMAINCNDPGAGWAGLGLPLLPDPLPGRPGPLAGILAAMHWAAGLGAGAVLTVPGDTPFVPGDLVARLQAGGLPAIAEAAGPDGSLRMHPVCGLWPTALAPRLAHDLAAGERRVAQWALAVGARRVRFDPGHPPAFFNVNTPEDLAQAAGWTLRPRPRD